MYPDINRLPPSVRAQAARYRGAVKAGLPASRAYFKIHAFAGAGISNGETIALIVGGFYNDPAYRAYRLEFRTDASWTVGGGHYIDLHLPYAALDTDAAVQAIIQTILASPAAPPNGTGNNVGGSQFFVANPSGATPNLVVNAYIRNDVDDALAIQASQHWTEPANLDAQATGEGDPGRPYELRIPLIDYSPKAIAFPYRVIVPPPDQEGGEENRIAPGSSGKARTRPRRKARPR
jgi:hypothetical protein